MSWLSGVRNTQHILILFEAKQTCKKSKVWIIERVDRTASNEKIDFIMNSIFISHSQ